MMFSVGGSLPPLSVYIIPHFHANVNTILYKNLFIFIVYLLFMGCFSARRTHDYNNILRDHCMFQSLCSPRQSSWAYYTPIAPYTPVIYSLQGYLRSAQMALFALYRPRDQQTTFHRAILNERGKISSIKKTPSTPFPRELSILYIIIYYIYSII